MKSVEVRLLTSNEVHVAGVYGVGFAAESLARVGARNGLRIKVGSDKELTEIRKVA